MKIRIKNYYRKNWGVRFFNCGFRKNRWFRFKEWANDPTGKRPIEADFQ